MKIAAVVCEYNPFHNGHKYQLSAAREILGCDGIVGIMSGNFVQRGAPAAFPKALRAKAALNCGMDLVLELPAVLTLQSAERYAANAVAVLNSMGCIDTLFFGAECPDTELLMKIAHVLTHEDSSFKSHLRHGLDMGMSFAAARAEAIKNVLGSASAGILSRPNNILAVEYCKALIRLQSKIHPFAIERTGAEHDSASKSGAFASATEIRRMLYKNEDACGYIPPGAEKLFSDTKPFPAGNMDRALIANICLMCASELSEIADVSEGLENALKTAALTASTLDDLIAGVKSKRYTYSRIRRIILNAYLGITKADSELSPPYIRILDFNDCGRTILNLARDTAALPLAKNGKQIKDNPAALELWRRELIIDRIYELWREQQ